MSYDDSAAPYVPGTPSYDTSPTTQQPAPRASRRGPLSARLAARARATPGLAPTSSTDDDAADVSAQADTGSEADGSDMYTPSSAAGAQAAPTWETFTTILHDPGDAAAALRTTPHFGARWNSRADMIGACLDEYYKTTAQYNDARTLLKEVEQDLMPLRRQQTSAHLAVRALEERLELHSRAELRTAYLGLAEIEMRIFRVEQERDQLSSRVETLEGFLDFLSRIISTIRTIPAEALDQPTPEAEADPSPKIEARPAEEEPGAVDRPEALDEIDQLDDAFEELVIDADEAAALAANGEVEVMGVEEEVSEASVSVKESDSLP
jgi:hypothetical protein